ncbi:Hypothetical protein A7982_00717 [Minicystis rosea]|nr:Hypothetical protein A7982_00717 [Minicystis rosea]
MTGLAPRGRWVGHCASPRIRERASRVLNRWIRAAAVDTLAIA